MPCLRHNSATDVPALLLPQDPDDLLFRVPRPLHSPVPLWSGLYLLPPDPIFPVDGAGSGWAFAQIDKPRRPDRLPALGSPRPGRWRAPPFWSRSWCRKNPRENRTRYFAEKPAAEPDPIFPVRLRPLGS